MVEYCNNISEDKIIVIGAVRISVITDRILRVERTDDGLFEDRPTQVVFDRNFAKTHFTYEKTDDKVLVKTQRKVFSVDLNTLKVLVQEGKNWVGENESWHLRSTASLHFFLWAMRLTF